MTKKELRTLMHRVYARNYTDIDAEHRLNHCTAWYYADEDFQAVSLCSYSSLVAVYYCGVVWEFDRWSNTTTYHVRSFANLMDASIISLYRRSGMSKSDYKKHMACDWQDVIDGVLNT